MAFQSREQRYYRKVDVGRRGILWTWDELAEYTGLSVHTLQRWHRRHPFPV